MSIEKVREYLKSYNKDGDIIEFNVSSATVELAAAALGCDGARIAKSMTFEGQDGVIMVVCAGDVKVDNAKFKGKFGVKAKMLSPDTLPELVGHAMGGVCPFALRENVKVYLDLSLKRFDTVYPACGSSNSAIPLSCDELQSLSGCAQWVDVTKPREV